MARFFKSLLRKILYLCFKTHPLDDDNLKSLWKNTSHVAVMAVSGIGDSIMATPLINAIKQCKPNCHLIVISSEGTQSVFRNNPYIDTIYVMPNGHFSIMKYLKFVASLYSEGIEFLFAAQPSNVIKCSLSALLSSAKIRLKHEYDYRNFDFIYHRCLPDDMARHRVELNLDFLRYLGEEIPGKIMLPKFYPGKAAMEFIEKKLQNEFAEYKGKIIALHAGGVRPNKHWDIRNYAAIGKLVIEKEYKVVLVGGQHEIKTNLQIKEMLNHSDCINFTNQLSLEETAAVLMQSKLLISNDTGIMHLATAVDVPVVAIFGPTDYRHIGPYSVTSTVIINETDIKFVGIDQVNKEINILLNSN